MVELLRHRQTKEAATDMFYLQPPRHISTLPIASILVCPGDVYFPLIATRKRMFPDVRKVPIASAGISPTGGSKRRGVR